MNPLLGIRTAWRSLRVNKMRSLLTVLGVIVGAAAVVCIISIGLGAQAQVSEKIQTLGANLLVISPGAQVSGGARQQAGTRHTLTEEDAQAILNQIESVQVAAPVLSRRMQVIAGDRNWSTLIAGVRTDYLIAREWPVVEGRPFSLEEMQYSAKVAVVGDVVRQELFGTKSAIGETMRIGNVPFTIVGVLDKKGEGAMGRNQDDLVFIPLSTAKSRVLGSVRGNSRDALDFIVVKVNDSNSVSRVREALAPLLRQRHQLPKGSHDDFSIENPTEILGAREGSIRTFALLLTAVASVSLLVGGISIMNIMLVSVTERTKEIGLRMALGARRRDIRRQFLIEAIALSLAGGLAGAVLGIVAAVAVGLYAQWPILISPWTVVLACGFAGVVGIAFGFYPAYRASCLDPIVALRYE